MSAADLASVCIVFIRVKFINITFWPETHNILYNLWAP